MLCSCGCGKQTKKIESCYCTGHYVRSNFTDEHKMNLSKSGKGKHNNSGSKNPMFGKKHSLETKNIIGTKSSLKIISEKTRKKLSLALMGNKNPRFCKSPNTHKFYKYNGMFLRSSYELRFVKACEKYGINFSQCTEPDRVILEDLKGKFSYLPDFKITNDIIEIKGWDGYRTQRIKDALKLLNIKVRFIYKQDLISFEKTGIL